MPDVCRPPACWAKRSTAAAQPLAGSLPSVHPPPSPSTPPNPPKPSPSPTKTLQQPPISQEGKYREAIRFYEPLVKKAADALLSVTAIVLANLCVAYIMTNQNPLAEELMKQVSRRAGGRRGFWGAWGRV